MSILDERDAYKKKNPYWNPEDEIYSDYTYFYVGISLCSILAIFLFVINFAFCYCSQYRQYWRDRHTGNRWINSLWTTTPHNSPPLDLTELEGGLKEYQTNQHQVDQYHDEEERRALPQYIELQKRESDI